MDSQQRLLFPCSALTSNALLQTFMCRQHFTNQTKADLLRIIFMPGAQIPSSLYSLEKFTTENADSSYPEVTEFHYCPG